MDRKASFQPLPPASSNPKLPVQGPTLAGQSIVPKMSLSSAAIKAGQVKTDAYHLVLWVQGHASLQELLVQEGHAGLQAPSKGRLVGSQHVPLVQPLNLPHCLPAGSTVF